ncbi:MAG TPA: cyclic dehypoxanthinyl futalosine synthase [Candidatus Omnitrophota bacterium]|nr:cyclic dehypoxanthinyl futalosine synthase [Candidatus Omnitrophota bacterium]HPS37475.1 cyclic dehypoxanthinyl futalosine synthase [Candidatus Omnitrophota bacterium]
MDIHDKILEKRIRGERLTLEDGVRLYTCDLLALGKAAQAVTPRLFRDAVTFVVDRNISYTNVCTIGCEFCAFHCVPGASGAYILSKEQILAKVQELSDLGGTQVLIQGGIHPDLRFDYYLDIVCAIREKFSKIHIHSFSAIEMDVLSQRSGIPLPDLFRRFKEAGLNSLPGGGAEILVERVRKLISPRKISSDRWLEVMKTAHEAGFKTTATMVFGHLETKEERIEHLIRLRELQDLTHGFRAFIPWSFMNFEPNAAPGVGPRKHEGSLRVLAGVRSAGGDDYLKTVAISRLMLDNFDHIQSGWLTEGLKLGQIALAFGCDDMGGTLFEDKVLEPTGIKVNTRREDLIRLIQDAGFVPVQRDTNYDVVKRFEEPWLER